MGKIKEIFRKINQKGISYIFTDAVPGKLWFFFDKPVSAIVRKLFLHNPLKDIIIIESHNDFDSNGGAFYDYLLKNGYNKEYKIVWFLRNKCPKNLPENVKGYRYNRLSILKAYYYCVAKYIVCGHYMIPSIRGGQVSYYTGHGGFGLKSVKGRIVVPDGISYTLAPSEFAKPIIAEEQGISNPEKRQIILGYPCHDVFYSDEEGDLHKVISGEHKYKKMILWMPTFRKTVDGRTDSAHLSPLGIPIINSLVAYENLNKELREEDVLLVIKIHPMQDLTGLKITSLSNIIVLDSNTVKKLGIDNYRLMKDASALISDYSSVAYDFLHLNKPLAYTLDDISDYERGLIVDNPETLMAGNIILNYDDFCGFILSVLKELDYYAEERDNLSKLIWKYHDGNSSKRLAEHMGLG